MTSRIASCACGQLRIHVEGDPAGVGVCHCLACQRSVGVAVGAFADPAFPAPSVSAYDCRRHPWVRLLPGTVAFEKDPP